MDTNLSKEENEQLIHYCAAFNLDPRTLDMTRELVQCYKRRNQCVSISYELIHIHPMQTILEKLEVIVSCAVLAASEAQVIRTVGNQKTRGVGISLGQLIKKHAWYTFAEFKKKAIHMLFILTFRIKLTLRFLIDTPPA